MRLPQTMLDGPGGSRSIRFQPPLQSEATRCLLVLDAELYQDRVGAPEIVSGLEQSGRLASTLCVYVPAGDGAARHRDFTCRGEYTAFLADELLPRVRESYPRVGECRLLGLSLSGLAAAFALWQRPDVFAGAICQSPSAWWNDEWLTAAMKECPPRLGRCWISVGDEELQQGVHHPPTGLYQGTSQRESVARLAARMQTLGLIVRQHVYPGGHDPACWARELPEALTWLMPEGEFPPAD